MSCGISDLGVSVIDFIFHLKYFALHLDLSFALHLDLSFFLLGSPHFYTRFFRSKNFSVFNTMYTVIQFCPSQKHFNDQDLKQHSYISHMNRIYDMLFVRKLHNTHVANLLFRISILLNISTTKNTLFPSSSLIKLCQTQLIRTDDSSFELTFSGSFMKMKSSLNVWLFLRKIENLLPRFNLLKNSWINLFYFSCVEYRKKSLLW